MNKKDFKIRNISMDEKKKENNFMSDDKKKE
jgi:hypothetical protein